jgi:hypothetical protein
VTIPTPENDIEFMRKLGFKPLTFPYLLPIEEEEFAGAVDNLSRGNIPYSLVYFTDNEVEIWTIPEFENEDDVA